MKKLLITILATVFAGTALSVVAQEPMKVRIGVEGAYPPFSYVTPEGELEGFDIDIAHALCEAMNAECTLVQQDWDGIIPALQARKYDAIIASMSITPERQERVDFTNKYYNTPARFIGKDDMDLDIVASGDDDITVGSLDQVELNQDALDGLVVGVQRATIHDRFVSEIFGDQVEIRRYGTQDEAYLDLVAGRLDLIMADSVAMLGGFLETEQGEGYSFVGPSFSIPQYHGEGAGIALRKNEDELREKFNAAIEQIRADGTYEAIQDKYFDFDVYGS